MPNNPFDQPDETQPADAGVFGEIPGGLQATNPTIRIKQISINDIHADITQPRNTAPSIIRMGWDGSPKQVQAVLKRWRELAEKIHGAPLPVAQMIMGNEEIPTVSDNSDYAPLAKYLGIVSLARSIFKKGLDSPIKVRQLDGYYQIVFGERRWTAYHLIYSVQRFEKEKWSKIKAQVDTMTDWQAKQAQAAENRQREDMNAISITRMVAVLVMEARIEDDKATYEPPSAFDHELDYYAQAVGERIPNNMKDNISAAVNMGEGQVRNYRGLLSMTDDIELNRILWTLGDDRDWSENFMREFSSYCTVSYLWMWVNNGADEDTIRDYIRAEKDRRKAEKAQDEADKSVTGVTLPDDNSPDKSVTGVTLLDDERPTPPLKRGEDAFPDMSINRGERKQYVGTDYYEDEERLAEEKRQAMASYVPPQQPKFRRFDWVIHNGFGLCQVVKVQGDAVHIMRDDNRKVMVVSDGLLKPAQPHGGRKNIVPDGNHPAPDSVSHQQKREAHEHSLTLFENLEKGMRVETTEGFAEVLYKVKEGVNVLVDGKGSMWLHHTCILGIQTELPLDEGDENNTGSTTPEDEQWKPPADIARLIATVKQLAIIALNLNLPNYDVELRQLAQFLEQIEAGDLDVSLSTLKKRFQQVEDVTHAILDTVDAHWQVITSKLGGE